jgi:hypothetical protein
MMDVNTEEILMAYNSNPESGSNRKTFRIALGLLMIGFSFYRLFMLLRVLPDLFEDGDTRELIIYGALPALIVVIFFFVGLRIVRQAYLGIDKTKRD